MAVTIKRGHYPDGRQVLLVGSPYNPYLPMRARQLGGRWQPNTRQWVFDTRDEVDVRALYVSIYGTDGSAVATVDLEVDSSEFDLSTDNRTAWFAGREIAHVFSRDGGARLGEGVRILAGSIGSGGSRNHPVITWYAVTVLVRDMPRSLVTLGEHVRLYQPEAPNGEGAMGDLPEVFQRALE